MTTVELAHEACGYAAHNKVCPLAIAQALRAQVELDAAIAALNELREAEDEARTALQAARW